MERFEKLKAERSVCGARVRESECEKKGEVKGGYRVKG